MTWLLASPLSFTHGDFSVVINLSSALPFKKKITWIWKQHSGYWAKTEYQFRFGISADPHSLCNVLPYLFVCVCVCVWVSENKNGCYHYISFGFCSRVLALWHISYSKLLKLPSQHSLCWLDLGDQHHWNSLMLTCASGGMDCEQHAGTLSPSAVLTGSKATWSTVTIVLMGGTLNKHRTSKFT